eukprot:NODE_2732_length_1107_cov_30.392857_g2607_i0.p1 GENE.NODE_2732_length_1107_cov_30.392857_g2607_i0~~NODE_2732_length_1107_cov_30.392857_g2607_i0.p1  ORF type:complete len:179 (-),score=32.27 NODE_2732_length_1107_cov_30.392857_g2607_i0:429-965(-)
MVMLERMLRRCSFDLNDCIVPCNCVVDPLRTPHTHCTPPALRVSVCLRDVPSRAFGQRGGVYEGYWQLQLGELRTAEVVGALIVCYHSHHGLPLLLPALRCSDPLCVEEGLFRVDDAYAAEVGCNTGEQVITGVYVAQNHTTKAQWPPAQHSLQSAAAVAAVDGYVRTDAPQVFVRLE